MKKLNEKQIQLFSEATLRKTAEIGIEHAKKNAPYIKKTIKDLKIHLPKETKPSIIISAGPSLHRNKSIETIKNSDFEGYIVAVDGTLGHCLRNGLIPDFVVTVDPHWLHRMIRWFGDPKISERPRDDYFQRQDLDPELNTDELARNKELIELVDLYGPEIKTIISTCINPEITERCLSAGMELYWWNPLYDDYEKEDSISRKVFQYNKIPCMVTGGNVGTSAWVFSHSVLESKDVVVVGMDNSYPPGTKVINTQYYEFLTEVFPGKPETGLIEVHNPYLKETWITDMAYCWYNEIFLKMAPLASCKTYNCTEGGILFGDGVEFIPLSAGLKRLTS